MTNLNKNVYIPIIKFRTANFKLPIELGRWDGTPTADRKCTLCNTNDIGDDFHYLFTCPYFANEREEFLKTYYYRRPNIIKYKNLLTCNNKPTLIKLSKFMKIIMEKFN